MCPRRRFNGAVIYTLQIHRKGEPEHDWHFLGQHGDANILADRARAMVQIWRIWKRKKKPYPHDAAPCAPPEGFQS